MSDIPFLYDVAIEGDYQVLIKWGETPNWIADHKELLENAHQISLIPKEQGNGMPVVTARLGDGKRWILFSRVVGQINGPKSLRMYAIGWQKTVKGSNIKSIQWVYPGGTIENAEEPTFIDRFLS
jgi:hypothetical protein